ncbi:hypothetical protein SynBIOSE41_02341 [Synechococcus sp. BIOS-E4-1]|uniref:hypothetical protein n=1 Tax=Synechococcus sp. BIOS-E4-1 TaxID=1400864 RepID=UPI001645623E|nr:hypothetical protein [Synechococcus sp. BIOS-E4-1]QNI54841.1 hypothetical protein SynBIOSE41_02341 [Synechococcus sp. BIOS-E4-1]
MTNIQEKLDDAVAAFKKNAETYEKLGQQLLVQQGAIQTLEQLLKDEQSERSAPASD